MKKFIGVIALVLTLIISVIYRSLTAGQAKEKPPRAYIPATLREGMAMSCLLLQ